MITYDIKIDENQRIALLLLIKEHGTNIEPLNLWVDMLTNLPKVEQEDPGVTHGFCL